MLCRIIGKRSNPKSLKVSRVYYKTNKMSMQKKNSKQKIADLDLGKGFTVVKKTGSFMGGLSNPGDMNVNCPSDPPTPTPPPPPPAPNNCYGGNCVKGCGE